LFIIYIHLNLCIHISHKFHINYASDTIYFLYRFLTCIIYVSYIFIYIHIILYTNVYQCCMFTIHLHNNNLLWILCFQFLVISYFYIYIFIYIYLCISCFTYLFLIIHISLHLSRYSLSFDITHISIFVVFCNVIYTYILFYIYIYV
jgi:hypothetical protein